MKCYMEKKLGHSSACNIYISKGSFVQGFLKLDTKKSLLVKFESRQEVLLYCN